MEVEAAVNQKEFEAVLKCEAKIRYEYFIKKVTDYEEVWALSEDGWMLSGNNHGEKYFPVWPKKEFANFCAINEWANARAEKIDLYEFMEELIPSFIQDGILLDVFSNNENSIGRQPEDLLEDLNEELENY